MTSGGSILIISAELLAADYGLVLVAYNIAIYTSFS
jgi:hypothetical protein